MIYQTDKALSREIQKYGCAFCSLAYYREKQGGPSWTARDLNAIWGLAKDQGIISGDLNGDGDTDDPGELEILNWNSLARLMGLPLRILTRPDSVGGITTHFPVGHPLAVGKFVIAQWFNPDTNFRHFVIGTSRPVEYDPIMGGSVTVREGYAETIRIFEELP